VLGGTVDGASSGDFYNDAPTVVLRPGTGSRVYDVKIGFDDNADASLAASEIDRWIKVYVVKADVKEVWFSATDSARYFPVAKDDGTGNYPNRQWYNTNPPDRVATNPGDCQYPVAYKRGAKMQVMTKLKLQIGAGATPNENLVVKGEQANGYTFYRRFGHDDSGYTMRLMGHELVMADDASSALANYIECFDTFDINWSVSYNNELSYNSVGTTKNQVYATLEKPTTTAFHTLLHLSCKNAKGLNNAATATAAIWSEFTDNIVYKAQLPGTTGAPTLLAYQHDALSFYDTRSFLRYGKGRCGAWARFLVDMLGVQGLQATVSAINPNVTPPTPPPGYFYDSAGLQVNPVPAQGSGGAAYTTVQFADHAVVKTNNVPNTIFDPSYGVSYTGGSMAVAEQAWEDGALAGFVFSYKDSPTTGISVFQADVKGVKEVTFSP
jgi:hypothetical protein